MRDFARRFLAGAKYDLQMTILSRMLCDDIMVIFECLLVLVIVLFQLMVFSVKAVVHIPSLPFLWTWAALTKPKTVDKVIKEIADQKKE